MRSRIGRHVAFFSVLCALGCGSDDKVLTGEDEPQTDGGKSDSGNTGATGADASGGATGSDDGGSTTGGMATDPTCDMNGIWIGNQITRSKALGVDQFSNNWYYLELTQNGDEVVVSKHFDCGVEVQGSVTVVLSKDAANALRAHNLQTGRKGTIKKNAQGKCDLTFDRFWSIRGADEAKFAPMPRNTTKSISEVAMTQPIPTKDKTSGAEDWDGDGKLGSSWQITGALSGVRNSVQRDWTEWFTDDTHSITAGMDFTSDLVIRSRFDNEENVIDASNPLLNQASMADASAPHILKLRFLGRTKTDTRVTTLVKANDFDTCLAVQSALPAQKSL